MLRFLLALGWFCCFPVVVVAQGELPAVVLLRLPESAIQKNGDAHGEAVFLDADATLMETVPDLGINRSVSLQNKVVMDTNHRRIFVAEPLFSRVAVLGNEGSLEKQIPVDDAGYLVLSPDGKTLACVTGKEMNSLQTAVFDVDSGMETDRFDFAGLAFANDPAESLIWAAGKEIVAFGLDGSIRIRRPLSQPPPERDHPTIINARNWCSTGVAAAPNENAAWRRFWFIERRHDDVSGSRNRLFALDPEGQIRILVELAEIEPVSLACATYRSGRHPICVILVVDRVTGDVVSFNSDGERTGRKSLQARQIAFGTDSGLWIAGRKFIRRIEPANLDVISEHEFEQEGEPAGLAAR